MDTGNIIRPGDSIFVTAPRAMSNNFLENKLRTLFPDVDISVSSVDTVDIRIVAHYRLGKD